MPAPEGSSVDGTAVHRLRERDVRVPMRDAGEPQVDDGNGSGYIVTYQGMARAVLRLRPGRHTRNSRAALGDV